MADKWEYKLVEAGWAPYFRNGKYEREFNALGEQGWELVSFANGVASFKRKIN